MQRIRFSIVIRFSIFVTLLFGVIWFALAAALNIGVLMPSGEQFAYSSKHNATRWDIHLFDIDRRTSANLTGSLLPEAARNRYPVWSPHGDYLLFATDLPRNNELALLHLPTGSMRYITNWRWDDLAPDWSPGNRARIAYVTSNGSSWDIGIVDLGLLRTPTLAMTHGDVILPVQDRVTIGTRGNEFAPRWSPDGRYLLYQSDVDGINDLFLSTPDGDTAQLTTGMMVTDGGVWSPDGSRVAFAGGRRNAREIYVLDMQSGDRTNITKSPHDDYDPVWSPDGERLVFVSDRDGDDDLYLLDLPRDADGPPVSVPRLLTDNPYPDYEPEWSPDGTRILYVAAPTITSELYLLHVDRARPPQRLTVNGREDWHPIWRPDRQQSQRDAS